MNLPEYLLAAAVVLVAIRLVMKPVTIVEYQRGLLYSKGRFLRVLAPGRHWLYAPSTMVRLVDARPKFVTVGGQEVLSVDGITLKVSLAARFQVTDPAKAINDVDNYENAFYLTLQMALRSIIGSATIDELLEKRDEFGPRLTELASADVEALGLRLVSADLKDIMLPGDVKKLFSQVVKARKDGAAALEKARGETAALRNLANAARLVEDSPSLLSLRALQQMGETTGNTLVLGVPSSMSIVPTGQKGQRVPSETEKD